MVHPDPAPRPSATIEMWFDFASPYSYLSLARGGPLAAQAGVTLVLRPFMLGPIFKAQGWDDTPFRLYPSKGIYMLRDVVRRATRFGVPYRPPSAVPRLGLLAARIATLGQDEAWCRPFCEAVFRENFVHDRDIQSPAVIAAVLQALGLPATLLEQAGEAPAKAALKAQTEEAARRGVFGAPAFFVGEELFWGDDRLEDALAWARAPGLPPAAPPATLAGSALQK
ncbi:2-hydroxychromene-2-carboxylate isomerase [plant metagenome]|uniref:2-hydroxychromene-2-carboxylate isomerase n=1 Tax=plant metagenome TaxID=1297885 RepID=A0A484PGW9_9ZZZZ